MIIIIFYKSGFVTLRKMNVDITLIDLIRKINNDFNQSIILTTHNPDVAKLGYSRYDLKNGFLKKMS